MRKRSLYWVWRMPPDRPSFVEALEKFRVEQTRAVLDHPDPREAP